MAFKQPFKAVPIVPGRRYRKTLRRRARGDVMRWLAIAGVAGVIAGLGSLAAGL